MPKIVQATVAEQRRWRRAELLRAGRELVMRHGLAGWSVRALADYAGVSRSAVYEYFVSGDQVLAEILLDELERHGQALRAMQAGMTDATQALTVWLERNLDYIADGSHALARALMPIAATSELKADIDRAHRGMYATALDSLRKLGVTDTAHAIAWIGAVMDAAARKIEGGAPLAEVRSSATAFVVAGVGALSASQPQS